MEIILFAIADKMLMLVATQRSFAKEKFLIR